MSDRTSRTERAKQERSPEKITGDVVMSLKILPAILTLQSMHTYPIISAFEWAPLRCSISAGALSPSQIGRAGYLPTRARKDACSLLQHRNTHTRTPFYMPRSEGVCVPLWKLREQTRRELDDDIRVYLYLPYYPAR